MSSHQGSQMVLETQEYLLLYCWTRHLNVHVHTRRKKKCVRLYTQTSTVYIQLHTSQSLSQGTEPWGSWVSDVCIVYSVVPMHVGDWWTFRTHSGLLLFRLTSVDSRALSNRAEWPSKRQGNKGGRDWRRQKRIIGSPPVVVHVLLCSSFWLVFDPFSSNLCPMGHQLTDSKSRVQPLFLSTLLSLFAIWDKLHL